MVPRPHPERISHEGLYGSSDRPMGPVAMISSEPEKFQPPAQVPQGSRWVTSGAPLLKETVAKPSLGSLNRSSRRPELNKPAVIAWFDRMVKLPIWVPQGASQRAVKVSLYAWTPMRPTPHGLRMPKHSLKPVT